MGPLQLVEFDRYFVGVSHEAGGALIHAILAAVAKAIDDKEHRPEKQRAELLEALQSSSFA